MILVADIGNSNIVLGLFTQEQILTQKIHHIWRLHTNELRTADEYTSILSSLFRDAKINAKHIDCVLMSSVVPSLIHVFEQALFSISGEKPIILNPELFDTLPINIVGTARAQVGMDLVANATAGYAFFKTACIVVDFGTALTFTIVDSSGTLQGVAIAPGLQTAVTSLFSHTAQLPSVLLKTPKSVLGKTTIEAIQSGIVLGYSDLVTGMLARIRSIDEYKHAPAIATGGLAHIIENAPSIFTHIDTQFTLKGLAYIAQCLKTAK